jgi:hypothetical protein
MKYYNVKTGVDVPSLKIKGTGLLYEFKTEEEYNESDYETCDMGTFEFEYDITEGTVLFTGEDADYINSNEFLENLIAILQQELNERKETI